MENDEDKYRLANWTPIWLDDGRSLQNTINTMQQLQLSEDYWIIVAAMIALQIQQDLDLHMLGKTFIENDGGETT